MILLASHSRKLKHSPLQIAHLEGDVGESSRAMIFSSPLHTSATFSPLYIEFSQSSVLQEEYGWSDFPAVAQIDIFFPSKTLKEYPNKNQLPKRRQRQTVPNNTSSQSRVTRRKSPKGKGKRVGFADVHIQEHAVTVGEHDWCNGELPLTLDWKHSHTRSMSVDDFEWMRYRQGRTPRGRLSKLEYLQRKKLLKRVSGFTEEELLQLEKLGKESHEGTAHNVLHRSNTMALFQSIELELDTTAS